MTYRSKGALATSLALGFLTCVMDLATLVAVPVKKWSSYEDWRSFENGAER